MIVLEPCGQGEDNVRNVLFVAGCSTDTYFLNLTSLEFLYKETFDEVSELH